MSKSGFKAGSARGNKEYGPYLCRVGAGAPPVCFPWCNRASGIPLHVFKDYREGKYSPIDNI